MERYYDKNEDDDDKEPLFGGDSDDSDEESGLEATLTSQLNQQGIIEIMHVEIAQTELNQQLLAKAMEIARQSWWWYFKSAQTRISEVEEIYRRLLNITENPEEEETEE